MKKYLGIILLSLVFFLPVQGATLISQQYDSDLSSITGRACQKFQGNDLVASTSLKSLVLQFYNSFATTTAISSDVQFYLIKEGHPDTGCEALVAGDYIASSVIAENSFSFSYSSDLTTVGNKIVTMTYASTTLPDYEIGPDMDFMLNYFYPFQVGGPTGNYNFQWYGSSNSDSYVSSDFDAGFNAAATTSVKDIYFILGGSDNEPVFSYPDNSSSVISVTRFTGYQPFDYPDTGFLHILVTDPNGLTREFTHLISTTTAGNTNFEFSQVFTVNGNYSYYGYFESFESNTYSGNSLTKNFSVNIPAGKINDLQYQLDNLPDLTMYDLTGSTTASSTSFGLDYRECSAMDFFTGADFIDCQYNVLVMLWNTFFIPADTSLDFIQSAWLDLQNVFPFNIFFGFNNLFRIYAETNFTNQDTDLNLTVSTFGLGNLHYLASTTISDLVGSGVKQQWDTLISSVVFLTVGLKIFMLIL